VLTLHLVLVSSARKCTSKLRSRDGLQGNWGIIKYPMHKRIKKSTDLAKSRMNFALEGEENPILTVGFTKPTCQRGIFLSIPADPTNG